MRCLRAVLAASAVGAVLVGLAGSAAEGTTTGPVLPQPPSAQISPRIGAAFEGDFYLTRLPSTAGILGARLDINLVTESNPPFYFGKLQMQVPNSSGKVEGEELALWWFRFHQKTDRLTARLIPPATVTLVHPNGETVGRISFTVPGGQTGVANHERELHKLSDVQLTLNGQTCELTFERGGQTGEAIEKIPSAHRYGGPCL